MGPDVSATRRDDLTLDDRLIAAVRAGWERDWTSPTVRELAAFGGMSVSSAKGRLDKLVRTGRLDVKRLSPQRVLYRPAAHEEWQHQLECARTVAAARRRAVAGVIEDDESVRPGELLD